MKPIYLIAIAILAFGCGEKNELTTKTKPLEEKRQEIKEEVKPKENSAENQLATKKSDQSLYDATLLGETEKVKKAIADGADVNTKGALHNAAVNALDTRDNEITELLIKNGADVNAEEVEDRDGIAYLKGSDTPYTGKVYGLYPNGHKEYETDFWNGKKDGIDTAWYENGNKKEEAIWKNGKQDGLQTRWYENGQKKNEANGKDGKMDGLWSEWYENGQKKVETNYKDGKEDGLMVGWHENGRKRFEGNMKNGKKDGVWTHWHKSGRKSMESHYKDGVGSDVKAWRATGELIE